MLFTITTLVFAYFQLLNICASAHAQTCCPLNRACAVGLSVGCVAGGVPDNLLQLNQCGSTITTLLFAYIQLLISLRMRRLVVRLTAHAP
jgi:hypothetical protein